ncbi:MAG: ribonuclease Z [Clostridia bacterium]|nr:ribonuclease Z [Clostridia bacterium]
MTVFVCLDDDGGMLFNRRRQSRDGAVQEALTAYARTHTLWMSRYSATLFDDATPFRVDDAYHEHMGDEEACFVEDGVLDVNRADELVVFRWNRRYPSDRRFPKEALTAAWVLIGTRDLIGTSHDCITEEHYRKKGVTA